ncbi:protein kinase-like domain, Phloem protein 2-like protein [Artemisia annua]|uniref:Protein kinase-like domain, Phloem protein 2-like protein n=1 Tax=Artemisia annua TaxID=35608 RepID=A0A2U1Q061_ARTAN|nr:protein kinase-like domain, Phloem protein 2-like protein [Artemisia annua]
MASFVTEFKHLEIQLEDIISATNNFDESKVIGRGGFGKVYAGELSHSQSEEKSLVAIKRLDRRYGQGDPEFFKEIRMLSCYRHENLISLLGFCCQGGEMILIYEYASRGSLDRYLSSADLTWTQRLRICIDAAKGLRFLHDPNGTQQRVLHCDIKSANILLDKNMTAKVSDFGLSKMGPANQQYSLLITSAVGTPGYCDPLYMQTYSLTKESDVYSFGVVLFEVLCGRLCFEISNGQLKVYVPLWRKCYEENKLDEIILQDLRKQMQLSSLKKFSDIASQCLRNAREERPTMSLVVEKLQIALQMQVLPKEYAKIANAAADPLPCRSLEEFKELLSKGVLLNRGETWLSFNDKEEHHVMVSIEEYLSLDDPNRDYNDRYSSNEKSRFAVGCYKTTLMEFKLRVTAPLFLSPDVIYGLSLVLHASEIEGMKQQYVGVRYKIHGETKISILYFADKKEGKQLVAELYQFNSTEESILDLEIFLEDCGLSGEFYIEGIEFRPLEKVVIANQEIVRGVVPPLFYRFTEEESKVLLSQGVLLNGGKMWLSVNEKGEHIERIYIQSLPFRLPLIPFRKEDLLVHGTLNSRFPAGLYQINGKRFKTHVKAELLSPKITYTVNLVYRSYSSDKQVYVDLKYRLRGEATTSVVYLANRRQDDWLYVAELYQFTSDGSIVDLEIIFENSGTDIDGVEGILFQPLEKVEDQSLEDDRVEDIETTSGSDTYWEQKIPNDYEETLKLSKVSLEWKTKKELYSILFKGFMLGNGQQCFSVDKNGKKCQMLSARAATSVKEEIDSNWESSNESRFGEVLVITAGYKFKIKRKIEPQEVSPETAYTAYIVFKLPQDLSTFEAPMFVCEKDGYMSDGWYIYLVSPPVTPVIGPKSDENTYNPLNRYKGNALPQQRTDGWMEVKVWQFKTTTESVPMNLYFEHPVKKDLKGLMIQGIELKPI